MVMVLFQAENSYCLEFFKFKIKSFEKNDACKNLTDTDSFM